LSFRDTADPGTPSARGLYDPALDKDSCGVGFIADLKGRKSHKIRPARPARAAWVVQRLLAARW
jgi:hypothetical protein